MGCLPVWDTAESGAHIECDNKLATGLPIRYAGGHAVTRQNTVAKGEIVLGQHACRRLLYRRHTSAYNKVQRLDFHKGPSS